MTEIIKKKPNHTTVDRRPGLVLTRKLGESVMVEHGLLEIQVVEIKGQQVRLKFLGNVQIHRAELLDPETHEMKEKT
jgi:carbon storage regulator CsrA